MPKRVMQGRVVSDKGDKTVIVLVERRVMDKVYKKFIRRSKKYAAHDDDNVFHVGDSVEIEECRPISARKRWRVISPPPGLTETLVHSDPAELVGHPAPDEAEHGVSA
jgi:small subunit ribosomal protein S17